VPVEIKFCGLTRAVDAQQAVALGAAYVGVIFAGGPRMVTPDAARGVLADVPGHVRRVGVFADQSATEIARIAKHLELDVVQLHGAPAADTVAAVRGVFAGEIWRVVRVNTTGLPADLVANGNGADAILLDAHVRGSALGGTGVTLPWAELASDIDGLRGRVKIVLAGGLRAENVIRAIAALGPDVVDVSSGVEVSPGIKDHERMRAFRDAVTHASTPK
jgi:phosphoribosylanthranilate isomerase